MRIAMLGPLDVRDGTGRPVEIGGSRLRALLIRLALEAGRSVPAERLIEDLWETTAPAGAVNALQALVSRLRGVGGRDAVVSTPGGYRLTADVDTAAFERLVTAARAEGDPAYRVALLREALGLWRGPALADVAEMAFAAGPIARLEELRISAVEDRVDAELTLGDGDGLVPELEELAVRHPLRERLRGQLMRALCAAGRRADALALYERTRRELADELGVDPSPQLASVHLAILRGETDGSPPSPLEIGKDPSKGLSNLPGPAHELRGPRSRAGPRRRAARRFPARHADRTRRSGQDPAGHRGRD
ncbi:hypothetical protein GCM10029978_118600 [Actinoallomurus acanthiterrae]